MTTDALNQLWTRHGEINMAELQYWRTADELLDAGVIDIYDVATIYGVCADTARKRLRNLRDSGNLVPGSRLFPFGGP